MDSALTPREIQSRIRAGEALEEVAKAAGVTPEKIAPYALPVIAEREHVAGTALSSPVRRGGEAAGARSLKIVANECLVNHLIDIDDVDWDAWRIMDRKWIVQALYSVDGEPKKAHFLYDQLGRFSVAHNDDARWLVQEPAPVVAAARPSHPMTEPENEPTVEIHNPNDPRSLAYPEPTVEQLILSDDLALREQNGVYDILSEEETGRIELDNLYDMFSAMQEDSVQIYPGFLGAAPVTANQSQENLPTHNTDQPLSRRDRRRLQAEQNLRTAATSSPGTVVPPPQPTRPEPQQHTLTSAVDDGEDHSWRHITRDVPTIPAVAVQPSAVEPTSSVTASSVSTPEAEREPAPVQSVSVAEPELAQDALIAVDSATEIEEEYTGQIPRVGRKKTVPSWDEIMFGSPRTKNGK